MTEILFCYENGDLEAYASLEELIRDLEPIDVANGEYKFWNDLLEEFSLDVQRWPSFWRDVSPQIRTLPRDFLGKDRIHDIMINYVRRFHVPTSDDQPQSLAQAILKFQQK